jgi:hypothetical protein
MAKFNPIVDYVDDLRKLRDIYVANPPKARFISIQKLLARNTDGIEKLITAVSGVEALARSMVVHWQSKGKDIENTYDIYKHKTPVQLIEEVFNIYKKVTPESYFTEDTWPLFKYAIEFRNLVVHECTFLGQDKFPSLISATEEVLSALADIGCLLIRPGSSQRRKNEP